MHNTACQPSGITPKTTQSHAHHLQTNNAPRGMHAQNNNVSPNEEVKPSLIAHYLTKIGGLGTIDLLTGKRRLWPSQKLSF
uniref:Uncharacterized protein n=1 Tax=Nelumbo nucifera TaxID=4432 RepID=A0A822ZAL6_NELNU|nr:TPA_asm: hypothetical protein HUJ06_001544 [Nelumbo nucifera]